MAVLSVDNYESDSTWAAGPDRMDPACTGLGLGLHESNTGLDWMLLCTYSGV